MHHRIIIKVLGVDIRKKVIFLQFDLKLVVWLFVQQTETQKIIIGELKVGLQVFVCLFLFVCCLFWTMMMILMMKSSTNWYLHIVVIHSQNNNYSVARARILLVCFCFVCCSEKTTMMGGEKNEIIFFSSSTTFEVITLVCVCLQITVRIFQASDKFLWLGI